ERSLQPTHVLGVDTACSGQGTLDVASAPLDACCTRWEYAGTAAIGTIQDPIVGGGFAGALAARTGVASRYVRSRSVHGLIARCSPGLTPTGAPCNRFPRQSTSWPRDW